MSVVPISGTRILSPELQNLTGRHGTCYCETPMSSGIRLRQFATLLLGIALAMPAGLATASQETSHQQCKAQHHRCGHPSITSCCCHDEQADPATPAQSSSGRAQVNAPTQPAGPVSDSTSASTDHVWSAALRFHSPPHGYHGADLSILLSTFLI